MIKKPIKKKKRNYHEKHKGQNFLQKQINIDKSILKKRFMVIVSSTYYKKYKNLIFTIVNLF